MQLRPLKDREVDRSTFGVYDQYVSRMDGIGQHSAAIATTLPTGGASVTARPLGELDKLPPLRTGDEVRTWLRALLDARNIKIAVVDDDPTGTQTVRDVPLVTEWTEDELTWAMSEAAPLFAVLTNTRALREEQAIAVNRDIGERLAVVADALDVDLRVISRGDSTLRGHFPAEPEALATGLAAGGRPIDCVVLCPAFPEAGRVTAGDVHWIARDGQLIPVGQTEYAADATFGYRSSNLLQWVRERAGRGATVASIGLDDVRYGGPVRVADRLLQVSRDVRYVVVNAVATADLEVVATGLALAEQGGLRAVCRSGPSFLSARAGWPTAPALDLERIAMPDGRGLVVVGSHTRLTTEQLAVAVDRHDLQVVELEVDRVIGDASSTRADAVGRATAALHGALSHGDAALVTSRKSAHGQRGPLSLGVAVDVANALVDVVTPIAQALPLAWLVAKGGITSHDMATRALGARRARVLGQLFVGQVSVWELGEGSVSPGLRYVVFPGNVGDAQMLARTLDRLGGRA